MKQQLIETTMDFNKLAKDIYEQNKAVGWWDDPDRCKLTLLQLVSTEIAEATEGERKNLMDDHLPHRKMGEVELADALIRLLDIGGAYGIKYNDHENLYNAGMIGNTETIAGKHFVLNTILSEFGRLVSAPAMQYRIDNSYTDMINAIEQVSKLHGYDLVGAMAEKLEYNKYRSDHKRENRSKENGKKF